MPECDQAGNLINPNGDGRTFYVGKRKNGKMLRVYEKGMLEVEGSEAKVIERLKRDGIPSRLNLLIPAVGEGWAK